MKGISDHLHRCHGILPHAHATVVVPFFTFYLWLTAKRTPVKSAKVHKTRVFHYYPLMNAVLQKMMRLQIAGISYQTRWKTTIFSQDTPICHH